jgi:hypothetical protein
MINIVKYFFCFFFAVSFFKIVVDPGYQMVLEDPFNKLMKEIWSDEFMYVGPRKIIGEWLEMSRVRKELDPNSSYTYYHIANNTIVFV